jgi:hypothetical protein
MFLSSSKLLGRYATPFYEVNAPSMRIPESINIELFIGPPARMASSSRVSVGQACSVWKVGGFSTINIPRGVICSSHFLGMLVTLFVIANLAIVSLRTKVRGCECQLEPKTWQAGD